MRTEAQPAQHRAVREPVHCAALIVDDHIDSAEMMVELLAENGIEARLAHDGASALQEIARETPDVVLLDLSLPGELDGYETARRIRTSRRDGCPVLIAVTGWAGPEITARAIEAGFDHHMVKPVDPAAILKLVHAACAMKDA